jgi:hypothetical protein
VWNFQDKYIILRETQNKRVKSMYSCVIWTCEKCCSNHSESCTLSWMSLSFLQKSATWTSSTSPSNIPPLQHPNNQDGPKFLLTLKSPGVKDWRSFSSGRAPT